MGAFQAMAAIELARANLHRGDQPSIHRVHARGSILAHDDRLDGLTGRSTTISSRGAKDGVRDKFQPTKVTVLNHSTLWIVAALVWFSSALIGVRITRSRGRPPAEGFTLGLVLGPLGVLLAALAHRSQPAKDPSSPGAPAVNRNPERSTSEMLVLAARFNTAFLILGIVITMAVVVLGLYYMSQPRP